MSHAYPRAPIFGKASTLFPSRHQDCVVEDKEEDGSFPAALSHTSVDAVSSRFPGLSIRKHVFNPPVELLNSQREVKASQHRGDLGQELVMINVVEGLLQVQEQEAEVDLELPECFSAALRPPNSPVETLGDFIEGKDMMVSGSARKTSLLSGGQKRKSFITEFICPTPNNALPEMV